MTDWTDDDIALASASWRAGKSASAIAAALNHRFSRLAVIGKMRRLKISQGSKGAIALHAAAPAKHRRPHEWTDEQIATLRKLHADKIPAGIIGFQLGRSYQAVITKMRKLGLLPLKNEYGGQGGQRPFTQFAVKAAYRELPDPLAPPPALDESGNRYTILTVSDRVCRWPHGDPAAVDFHFCGRGVKPGRDYCPYHVARGDQKPGAPDMENAA